LLSVLEIIKNDKMFKDYILVGGTSLALQLGHRKSDDIDLFTPNEQNNELCIQFMRNNFEKVEILNNNKNILQIKVNDLKIDLVSAKGNLIESLIQEGNIILASKKDIVGMKFTAIQDRKKAKDYIDIAYLLLEIKLDEMFEIYKWKYSIDNIYTVKIALVDSYKINPYDWYSVNMIKNDIEIQDIPKFINDKLLQYNNKCNIGKSNGKKY